MAKKQKRIHPHDVNMPELFGDLIRERSLYGVLDSLAQACTARADLFRERLDGARHPTVEPLDDVEIEFFDEAADNVQLIRSMLETEWPENAPSCADGDFLRSMRYSAKIAQKYFVELAATLNNPDASDEDRRQAAETLAKEGEGTIWTNRKTGQPSFEMANLFRTMTAALVAPETPEDERRDLASKVQQLVSL